MGGIERARARKKLHKVAFGSRRGRLVQVLAGLAMFVMVFLLARLVGNFYVRGELQNTLVTSTGIGVIAFFWGVFLEAYAVACHGNRLDEILAADLEQSATRKGWE